jgi:hypothetical protein
MRGEKQAAILLLAAALVCATALSVRAFDSAKRDAGLQAAFDQFPLLKMETNALGELAFQTLKFDEDVKVDGKEYYGFRFQVPPRTNHEDFVWAFIQPQKLAGWYIVAQKGDMDGFEDFHYRPKTNYTGVEHLFPTSGKQLITQRLAGSDLEDGKTYLVWFTFNKGKPNQMSLKFTFADLGKKKNKVPAMEKALGLARR